MFFGDGVFAVGSLHTSMFWKDVSQVWVLQTKDLLKIARLSMKFLRRELFCQCILAKPLHAWDFLFRDQNMYSMVMADRTERFKEVLIRIFKLIISHNKSFYQTSACVTVYNRGSFDPESPNTLPMSSMYGIIIYLGLYFSGFC